MESIKDWGLAHTHHHVLPTDKATITSRTYSLNATNWLSKQFEWATSTTQTQLQPKLIIIITSVQYNLSTCSNALKFRSRVCKDFFMPLLSFLEFDSANSSKQSFTSATLRLDVINVFPSTTLPQNKQRKQNCQTVTEVLKVFVESVRLTRVANCLTYAGVTQYLPLSGHRFFNT